MALSICSTLHLYFMYDIDQSSWSEIKWQVAMDNSDSHNMLCYYITCFDPLESRWLGGTY